MGAHASKITPEMTKLDLADVKLQQIPDEIPPNQLSYVRLSHNGMPSPNLPMNHKFIQHLMLDWNGISELSDRMIAALASYPKLENLDLSINNIQVIPPSFASVQTLKELNLFNNKISRYDIALPKLTHLLIGQNRLKEIPRQIVDSIVVLDMDFNFLTELNVALPRCQKLSLVLVGLEGINPKLIFPRLAKLNLERNRLKTLPDFTVFAPALRELNVAFNFLTEFPSVSREKIEVVNIRYNKITHLPFDLALYDKMTSLDFSHNMIDFVPLVPMQIVRIFGSDNTIEAVSAAETPSLQTFMLSNNRLHTLPQFVNNKMTDYVVNDNLVEKIDLELMSKEITTLSLASNRIKEIPPQLFQYPNLRRLILVRNLIEWIPMEILSSKIEFLNLTANPLKAIPRLPQTIKHLAVSYCGLTEIPDHVAQLPQLTNLFAAGNALSRVPSFVSVKMLFLSHNRIREWPASIDPGLEMLDFSCNELTTVPPLAFEKLLDLDLSHNRLTAIPQLQCPALNTLKLAHNPIEAEVEAATFNKLLHMDIVGTKIKLTGKCTIREWFSSDPTLTNVHAKYIYSSPKVAECETRGVRPSMEDAIMVHKDILPGLDIYAVFDGHGGFNTAVYGTKVLKNLIKASQGFQFTTTSITQLIQKMTEEIMKRKFTDGSTMACGFVCQGRLISAHIGDARLLLVTRSGEVRFATRDHKTTERTEFERVHSVYGSILRERVDNILAVPRSLGDRRVKGMSSEPEVCEIGIEDKDRWLIICCDGVYDVLSNKIIGQLAAQMQSANQFAYTLRNLALSWGSGDNISSIVVDLS